MKKPYKQLEKLDELLDELLASASKCKNKIDNEVEKNFYLNKDDMEFYKYQCRMNDEEYNLLMADADRTATEILKTNN